MIKACAGLAVLLVACDAQVPANCGAAVKLYVVDGPHVSLWIENVSDQTIQIGGSPQAQFVGRDGAVMSTVMRPSSDDWFMPFSLPSKSHRTATVTLDGAGASLTRVQIPDSGPGPVPRCTIDATHLQ